MDQNDKKKMLYKNCHQQQLLCYILKPVVGGDVYRV